MAGCCFFKNNLHYSVYFVTCPLNCSKYSSLLLYVLCLILGISQTINISDLLTFQDFGVAGNSLKRLWRMVNVIIKLGRRAD